MHVVERSRRHFLGQAIRLCGAVPLGYLGSQDILKGVRPGDLPIRHPARYFLTINAGAARRVGLVLPAQFVATADRVIA